MVNNNVVNGSVAGFNSITCEPSANTLLNLATIDGTGAYLYLQAPSTNTVGIAVGYTGQQSTLNGSATGSFVYLSPGDVAFVPVGLGTTAAASIIAKAGATATLNFFLGEK